MKYLGNERGYALLIVLLLVVLMLGVSAVFMGGSMNHAKQEETVDRSNQSIAAAEMGVLYYSSDFQRSITTIRQEVADRTRIELNALVACIESSAKIGCALSSERSAWEQRIDNDMKAMYVRNILKRINEFRVVTEAKMEPFENAQASYAAQTWKLGNIPYNDAELTAIEPALIAKIIAAGELGVIAEIEGISTASPKTLETVFNLEIPESFLNATEVYQIDLTTIAQNEDAEYSDIFKSIEPDKSCAALLEEVKSKDAKAPFECKLGGTSKLDTFINQVNANGYDPKDFWVYVNNFKDNVCSGNCNSLDFLGTNVVVKKDDADAANNMNNLVNGNLIIGALETSQNLNNLGKNGSKQTIVLKELDIGSNIKNLNYTNLLVLGINGSGANDSRLRVAGQFQIDNYSRLCMDIDQIIEDDLINLASMVEVTNSGRIVYYTTDPNKQFVLTGTNGAERTELHVSRINNYSTFLANCGITMKSTQTVPVASPINQYPDFLFDVLY